MLMKALVAFVLALASLGAFEIQNQVQLHEEPFPHCFPCPK